MDLMVFINKLFARQAVRLFYMRNKLYGFYGVYGFYFPLMIMLIKSN
nr:hypothetical protein PB20LOC_02136 [Pectobacterium parmentieri]